MQDTITKSALLDAPLAKVWNAVSDSTAFGAWFGMTIDGPFVEGQTAQGAIAPTQVDDEIAKHQQEHVGTPCPLRIERLVENCQFSFRWHPEADSLTTLVTFDLEEKPNGTQLTITETGFESLPAERRASAMADNSEGWQAQLSLIAKYLAR